MSINSVKLEPATTEDLFRISLASSLAKNHEVYIFELGQMGDLFDVKQAEELRSNFLKNDIKVKQITNSPELPKFTENQEFVNKVMSFRYVPREIFDITYEILIFDSTVAVYNHTHMFTIEDDIFARNQRQLFLSIWEQGQPPVLGFDYRPNHSYFNNLNYFVGDIQVIVWPDVDAQTAYAGFTESTLGTYLTHIIQSDDYFKDASYIVSFIWSHEGKKMVDIWKFSGNTVDDRSGPLGDVRVYREGILTNDIGLASGNTLLILGYEEKQRRQSRNLKEYLVYC